MSFATAALVLAWIVLALLVLVVAGLVRLVSELRDRPAAAEGVRVDALVGFGLPSGGPLASLRPTGAGVVFFSSPSCASCADVRDSLARAELGARVVVASLGDCSDGGGLPYARCVPNAGEAMDRLGVPGTPYLLALDAAGTMTGGLMPESPDEVGAWIDAVLPASKEGS